MCTFVWVSVCTFVCVCVHLCGRVYMYYFLVSVLLFELFQVNASLLPLCGLCVASHLISPPSKLPDLFPVLISSFSFLYFVSFALFYHWEQLFGSS